MQSDSCIKLSDLYTMDFSITDLFGIRQKWVSGVLFSMSRPRKSNGIIYLNGCSGRYTDKYGKTFEAPMKSFVCLPAGSTYSVLNVDCSMDDVDAYLIEFNMIKDGKPLLLHDFPFRLNIANPYLAATLIRDAVKAYEAPVQSPPAVKAAIYNFISFLGKESFKEYNQKYRLISAGLEIIEENPVANIPIREIAAACNLSDGCFRKHFKEYSGKSPLQYRLDLKIKMAQNMLESQNTTSEDISNLLGFESSAYFCKQFKKKTGMTPSEYRKSR